MLDQELVFRGSDRRPYFRGHGEIDGELVPEIIIKLGGASIYLSVSNAEYPDEERWYPFTSAEWAEFSRTLTSIGDTFPTLPYRETEEGITEVNVIPFPLTEKVA